MGGRISPESVDGLGRNTHKRNDSIFGRRGDFSQNSCVLPLNPLPLKTESLRVRACAKITWQIELITVRPEVSKGSGGHSCFDTCLTDGRQASA